MFMPIYQCCPQLGHKVFFFQQAIVKAEIHNWSKYWKYVTIKCSGKNRTSMLPFTKARKHHRRGGWRMVKVRGTLKCCLMDFPWPLNYEWTNGVIPVKCAQQNQESRRKPARQNKCISKSGRENKKEEWEVNIITILCMHVWNLQK